MSEISVPALRNAATQLRIDSVRSTSEAGSGHPTTCCRRPRSSPRCSSPRCASTRKDPQNPDNDRFVLSKGHAAPILYAAWAEAGLFPREELLKLRRIDSDLEGHPTPRLPFVDVATGSLGQGICAADRHRAQRAPDRVRLPHLRAARRRRDGRRLGVGSGRRRRCTTSSTTSAASSTSTALGQSQATQFGHDMDADRRAAGSAFGWHAHRRRRPRHPGAARRVRRSAGDQGTADDDPGADAEGQRALVDRRQGRLARQGAQEGRGDRRRDRGAREAVRAGRADGPSIQRPPVENRPRRDEPTTRSCRRPPTSWAIRSRRARRTAPRSRQSAPSTSASSRSTPTSRTRPSATSSRRRTRIASIENFIAEQVMVGAAMGLAARGAIPFPSTFACFLTRAADFIRMAAISIRQRQAGRLARRRLDRRGRPVADGARRSGDDARACRTARCSIRATRSAPSGSSPRWPQHQGLAYMRTSRPKTPVIYGPDETFPIGGSKVLRQSGERRRRRSSAPASRVFEALKAYDQLEGRGHRTSASSTPTRCSRSTPRRSIAAGKATSGRIDHRRGSLRRRRHRRRGREAVAPAGFAVHRLAVREIPRSGKPEELLDRYGISAKHIVEAVKKLL